MVTLSHFVEGLLFILIGINSVYFVEFGGHVRYWDIALLFGILVLLRTVFLAFLTLILNL